MIPIEANGHNVAPPPRAKDTTSSLMKQLVLLLSTTENLLAANIPTAYDKTISIVTSTNIEIPISTVPPSPSSQLRGQCRPSRSFVKRRYLKSSSPSSVEEGRSIAYADPGQRCSRLECLLRRSFPFRSRRPAAIVRTARKIAASFRQGLSRDRTFASNTISSLSALNGTPWR